MTPEERDRMNALCQQIQQEKNYEKFEELTRQLNDLVARKERRFPERKFFISNPTGKAWKLMAARAIKIIGPSGYRLDEIVEISIAEAEDLFREIRVENSLVDDQGNALALRSGDLLDVRLEANATNLIRKPSPRP
jgi:hypothetical protein